jgi:hypothetical protein
MSEQLEDYAWRGNGPEVPPPGDETGEGQPTPQPVTKLPGEGQP